MKQSLSGRWEFCRDAAGGADGEWRAIQVPGCWEDVGIAKNDPGPFWFRRRFQWPELRENEQVRLHFDAVSYACEIFIDGHAIGTHIGLWDRFYFNVTPLSRPGKAAELLVRVEKPTSLTAGPDSPAVPGRYPQKQTLGGFLPYVWGHMFGGIWQDVWLATGKAFVDEFVAQGDHEGRVRIKVRLSAATKLEFEVVDPRGKVLEHLAMNTNKVKFEGGLLEPFEPEPWTPDSPSLYTARIRLEGGQVHERRFGLRSFRADGTDLLLNEKPIYPRMALSWGWYENSLFANPGREQVRRDFERLKAMGYNGVKLCLWVPPPCYFDLADELGMLLWLELPMWMPQATPFFIQQTPIEYERILRQVCGHPSLVLYTLGCELDAGVGSDFLRCLYDAAKKQTGDALLRDNSGSGEAYGGLLDEFADFYDYHFYSDIQFFRPLVESFSTRTRPEQPWLFGEYCDMDAWRDFRDLGEDAADRPWWTRRDDAINPQGARWQFDIVDHEARLKANGLWEHGRRLKEISERQALLHRKFTLEATRGYREISGYVITGERDTPISTSGMLDDRGELRFDPETFRAFNDDLVLCLGWDKRRAWINGGDRAAFWDNFSYVAGDQVRPHLVLSHYGRQAGPPEVRWRVEADGVTVATGTCEVEHREPGTVREVGIARFTAPPVDRPTKLVLHASARVEGQATRNEWSIWVFPKPDDSSLPAVSVHDPLGLLDGVGPWLTGREEADAPFIATQWDAATQARVEAGGRGVLLLTNPAMASPLGLKAMPFWREAVKLIEPHAAWGDFPHEGWCDLQFFGLATDLAMVPVDNARPILRRVDARTCAIHDYAVEMRIGSGRLIVTTLRFAGGLGDQPVGLSRNTAAAWLLGCFARYLAR